MLIIIPREILAIRVATTGPPGVDTSIVAGGMHQSIKEAMYNYLCNNHRCKEDAARDLSNTVPLQAPTSASQTSTSPSANHVSGWPGRQLPLRNQTLGDATISIFSSSV